MRRNGNEPRAYFVLSARSAYTPRQVYGLIQEVQRDMGSRQVMGKVGWSMTTNNTGRYVVAFERDESADRFERLYRQVTGATLHRQRRCPDGVVLVHTDQLVANAAAFLRAVCDHPSHTASQN